MLTISISPSKWLLVGISAAHAVAGGLVLMVDIPISIKAMVLVILCLSLTFYVLRLALLRSRHSIVAIEFVKAGRVAFLTQDGKWCGATILPTSFVSPKLTVLNFRPDQSVRTRSAVIVPDNVDDDEFRQMRIWLRWKS